MRSANLTVITDAGEKTGREVAVRFEQMRAIFGVIFTKARFEQGVPLTVIAFRNRKGMETVAPLFEGKPIRLSGLFQGGDGANYIALDLSSHDRWSVVFHEYAHLLVKANGLRAPAWFQEGFAEYYSTIRLLKDKFILGEIPRSAPQILSQHRMMPAEQLFAVDRYSKAYNVGQERSLFYAQSWLAVHYLMLDPERNKKLQLYLALAEKNVPAGEAIRQALGMEPKEFDKALQTYLRTGQATVYEIAMPAGVRDVETSVRPLSSADARAAIAELKLQNELRWEEAMREFEEIVQAEPSHAAAHRGLGYAWMRKGDWEKAATHFQRAAELDSNDPRVHYLYGMLLLRRGARQQGSDLSAELKRSAERAIALDPRLADAYDLLAFAHLSDDAPQAAEAALKKAVELRPGHDPFSLNLANVYMQLQKWDEADALLQGLVRSETPGIAMQAQSMLGTLEQLRNNRGLMLVRRGDHASYTEPGEPGAEPAGSPELTPRGSGAPLAYFRGLLLEVSCKGDGETVFKVDLAMHVAEFIASDRSTVDFSGETPFSCGLRKRNVEGYYRQEGERRVLVAIEIE